MSEEELNQHIYEPGNGQTATKRKGESMNDFIKSYRFEAEYEYVVSMTERQYYHEQYGYVDEKRDVSELLEITIKAAKKEEKEPYKLKRVKLVGAYIKERGENNERED